jgi:hypothetical protein
MSPSARARSGGDRHGRLLEAGAAARSRRWLASQGSRSALSPPSWDFGRIPAIVATLGLSASIAQEFSLGGSWLSGLPWA